MKDAFALENNKYNNMTFAEAYDRAKENAMVEFERNARLGIQLSMTYMKLAEEEGLVAPQNIVRTWFITIRPDEKKISFVDFKDVVEKYVKRKCFITYAYSFEQKSEDEETLGKGFHAHICANMTQRSKGEVLRDTQNTFKHCTAKNCIDVQLCKDPVTLINNYLVEYKSDDGHKEKTKDSDRLFREQQGLQALYINWESIAGCLSSP